MLVPRAQIFRQGNELVTVVGGRAIRSIIVPAYLRGSVRRSIKDNPPLAERESLGQGAGEKPVAADRKDIAQETGRDEQKAEAEKPVPVRTLAGGL